MKPSNVLILPGWQNSGPRHWQSLWEAQYGYTRVEQHDWMHPLRGDWISRLEDLLLACDEPVVLVAHSLGCLLTAAWASHSKHTARVKAALLVAPGDVALEAIRPLLYSWSPIALQPLPFPSTLVASRNDRYCSVERAELFATRWGAEFVDHGNCGHINAESGLGDWPDGYALLKKIM